ncbi:hypothetical protein AMECASPLE_023370, partial [Ameca splendens]
YRKQELDEAFVDFIVKDPQPFSPVALPSNTQLIGGQQAGAFTAENHQRQLSRLLLSGWNPEGGPIHLTVHPPTVRSSGWKERERKFQSPYKSLACQTHPHGVTDLFPGNIQTLEHKLPRPKPDPQTTTFSSPVVQ